MNSRSGRNWFIVHLKSWESAAALACTATLLVIDAYLYRAGLSWTPLHYESLAPLLVMGARDRRHSLVSAAAAALLFGGIAIIFFAFGLTFHLAAELWIFLGGVITALLAWLQPVLANAWRYRWLPVVFLLVASGLVTADKAFSRDMLASAYLPHFFKMSAVSSASSSHNAVYASLRQQLSPGLGGVLVVFESLGVPKDASEVQAIARDYPDFEVSTLPFEGGSTVPAEVRYLCGINGNIADFAPCLPKQLTSHAMHGNSLSYFSRYLLYRNMGFSQLGGKREFASLASCQYSYSAICDHALWDKLLADVRASSCQDFHYLLTIDAHFPYTKYARHIEGLYADVRQLLEVMRRIRHEFPECRIVIAGDHPPPLAQGFESHQVLVVTARP